MIIKNFAIVILFFFHLFFLLDTFSGQTGRSFLSKNMDRYPRHVWSRLDLCTPANVFVYALLIVVPGESDRYLPDMQVEFKTRLGTV